MNRPGTIRAALAAVAVAIFATTYAPTLAARLIQSGATLAP